MPNREITCQGRNGAKHGACFCCQAVSLIGGSERSRYKQEFALVVIPGYKVWLSAAEQCRGTMWKASWLLSPVTEPWLSALAGVRVDHQIGSYPGAQKPRKNRDEFINYTVRVMVSFFYYLS